MMDDRLDEAVRESLLEVREDMPEGALVTGWVTVSAVLGDDGETHVFAKTAEGVGDLEAVGMLEIAKSMFVTQ